MPPPFVSIVFGGTWKTSAQLTTRCSHAYRTTLAFFVSLSSGVASCAFKFCQKCKTKLATMQKNLCQTSIPFVHFVVRCCVPVLCAYRVSVHVGSRKILISTKASSFFHTFCSDAPPYEPQRTLSQQGVENLQYRCRYTVDSISSFVSRPPTRLTIHEIFSFVKFLLLKTFSLQICAGMIREFDP